MNSLPIHLGLNAISKFKKRIEHSRTKLNKTIADHFHNKAYVLGFAGKDARTELVGKQERE